MAYKGLSAYGEPVGPDELADVQEELRRLQTENIQLRDKNEALLQKFESLQGQFGSLALSKTDISTQLLMTEEEKLKVSKTLVEMQLENNKLREESEAAKFELTNKVLQLENKITDLELEKDKHMKISRQSREKLNEIEKDRKELADEYVNIKSNYLSVKKRLEEEVTNNEELCIEVLNLANAKAALMRELEDLLHSDYRHGDPSSELDRVRAVVNRLSTRKADDLVAALRDNLEKELFGNSKYYETELQRMRFQHEDDLRKLEIKLALNTKDLHETRNQARERQKKLSELKAQIITIKSERDQLRSQNNRMQHKLKDINDEFRSRLVKYVEDIAEYVDKKFTFNGEKASEQMTDYVRKMMKDLNKAHKIREEQLSQAAQLYKQRMNQLIQRYEMLLLAYSELRNQVEVRDLEDFDLGPEEHQLVLDEVELNSEQQRKIKQLQSEKLELQAEVESFTRRSILKGDSAIKLDIAGSHAPSPTDPSGKSWANLRKQLREFTLNTQQELELERAELLTRNAMLEQELKELNDYIDNHLTRYREEIESLRGQLGIGHTTGFTSPGDRSRPRRR